MTSLLLQGCAQGGHYRSRVRARGDSVCPRCRGRRRSPLLLGAVGVALPGGFGRLHPRGASGGGRARLGSAPPPGSPSLPPGVCPGTSRRHRGRLRGGGEGQQRGGGGQRCQHRGSAAERAAPAPGSPPQPPQPRRPHGGTGTAAQPPGGGHRRASSPARKCPGRGGGGEARGGRESGRRPAPRQEPTRSVRERRARPGPAAPARPLSAADGPAQIPHLSRPSPQRRNTPVSPWPLTPRSPQSPRGPPCFLLIREGLSRRSPGPAACRALVAHLATCAPLPSPSQRGSSVHASARAVAPTFSRVEHERDLSFGSFSITIPGMRQQ